jgi:hypothetical protein
MGKMNVPVLEKYQLIEFLPLVDSIKTGDLRTFNDGLLKYQDLFIRYAESLLVDLLDFDKSPSHTNHLGVAFISSLKNARLYAIAIFSSGFMQFL